MQEALKKALSPPAAGIFSPPALFAFPPPTSLTLTPSWLQCQQPTPQAGTPAAADATAYGDKRTPTAHADASPLNHLLRAAAHVAHPTLAAAPTTGVAPLLRQQRFFSPMFQPQRLVSPFLSLSRAAAEAAAVADTSDHDDEATKGVEPWSMYREAATEQVEEQQQKEKTTTTTTTTTTTKKKKKKATSTTKKPIQKPNLRKRPRRQRHLPTRKKEKPLTPPTRALPPLPGVDAPPQTRTSKAKKATPRPKGRPRSACEKCRQLKLRCVHNALGHED